MEEAKQRVLVTGGAGRLGLRVCRVPRNLVELIGKAQAFELDASALKLMFRLPLDDRLEFGHPDEVARAVAYAVRRFPAVQGRALIVAGGPAQRIRHRDLETELSRRLTEPAFWFARRCVGPVFGSLIVRLLASRYGIKSRRSVEVA